MMMLTREQILTLPPIGTGGSVAQVKWFCPWNSWTWYCAEVSAVLADDTDVALTDPRAADKSDVRCWGLVDGLATEYGYWLLSQLTELEGPGGLRIERDLHFKAASLDKCVTKWRR